MSVAGAIAPAAAMGIAPDPQSRLTDLRPSAHEEIPAGFVRRSAAAAIDGVVVILVQLAVAAVLIGGFGLSTSRDAIGTADLPYYALMIAFLILYFAKTESGPRAASWGKRALGLAVRDRHGEAPSFARALLRLLLRLLTVATLLLGWLTILFTPRRQALHDLLSGTVVVTAGTFDSPDDQEESRT